MSLILPMSSITIPREQIQNSSGFLSSTVSCFTMGKRGSDRVNLPMGELRKYTEKELEDLLRFPQSKWHGIVNPEVVEKAAIWHILTVREKTDYGGMSGLWIKNVLHPMDLSEIMEPTGKEIDVSLFGPIFLCIGEDANLAVEIKVMTNVFEYFNVSRN